MADESVDPKQNPAVTRRTFLGATVAGGAALLAGGSDAIFGATSSTTMNTATNPTWQLGGDLTVNRLGFGAMRITGKGIWGWPPDRNNAIKVLKRAVELGVNLIDTADAYGPVPSELLIAEAPHRSESAHGGFARSAQGNAGRREDPPHRIIEREPGGNRAGAQGCSNCECAERV